MLTATPYNNRPQDLFALIKLFQTPSRSTIHSVDNLGVRFHELIAQYNRWEKEGKKGLTSEIKCELDQLSQQLRILIDPVIVRRSRIDLQEIKEYAEDLKIQGIQFPQVVGPELVEYDLGEIRPLYLHTLDLLSNKFICARYNPAAYLVNPDAFLKNTVSFSVNLMFVSSKATWLCLLRDCSLCALKALSLPSSQRHKHFVVL